MNNFPNFDNPYGNLAQATYPKNPNDFASHSNKKTYVKFDFSQDTPYDGKIIPGGQNLPNNGVVYLQPDLTLRSVTQTIDLPLPPLTFSYPPATVTTNVSYQKGLLTDEPAGFNAYFSLDRNETIESQLAYFFMFDSRSCGILVL